VVDVDKLNLEDVPQTQTLGNSMAKRLRSNKGKVVPAVSQTSKKTDTTVTETLKRRTKSAGIGPKKSWSKVMVKATAGSSKKRKVVSSSESEYDVEKDVPNIIPSDFMKTDKKDLQVVEDVPIDKVSFHLPSFAQRWKFIYHRRLALERELSEEVLKIEEVMSLIKEAGLEKTVCNLGECYEKLVREFLVNIPKDCDNPLRKDYIKVFVRGECDNFSPNIINSFLGVEGGAAEVKATDNQICKEITANKVKVWPKKGKISSGKLSIKYAVLNRIGAANWVPTTHSSDIATSLGKFIYAIGTKTKMDIGRYVFEQTVKHAKTDAVRFPIDFPTLLCNIMLSQHPGLISADHMPMKRESPLTFHQKLFGDNHAPDLVGTSASIPSTGIMTKEEIIAALKDTCAMLDERKAKFELMIHALEGEDAGIVDKELESEKEVEDESEKEDEEAENEDEEADDKDEEEASGSSSEAEE
jgi:hypothetical protein